MRNSSAHICFRYFILADNYLEYVLNEQMRAGSGTQFHCLNQNNAIYIEIKLNKIYNAHVPTGLDTSY